MSARKIFSALILVLYASCSFAEITPQQVLRDPRFFPLVRVTKEKGAERLPGRYICAAEIPSRTGGQKILAPTSSVIEIGKFSEELNAYPFHLDIHGEKQADGYMTLDTEKTAPMLLSYTKNQSGQYELTGRSYAVLSDGDNSWLTGTVSDGMLNMLIPIGNIYYPEGWYLGAWKCEDGTQFTFDGGKMYSNGHEIGTFTVEDNRITVTAPDGSKDTVYAIWNPFKQILVITFNSGPNGMGANAGVFEKMKEAPKPVKTPKTDQNLNINGVWGAYVDGKQFIVQYQGNNYYGWIDGQPSEMGIITVKGKTLTGKNNKGVEFTAELELNDEGTELVMTFENGNTIRYMKLK